MIPDDATAETYEPDDGPSYRATRHAEEVPAFLDRALAFIDREEPEEDTLFEGVEVAASGGVWLLPVGLYAPDYEDDPETHPDEDHRRVAELAGGYGSLMLAWERDVRRALRESWGMPAVHTPRVVGAASEPEGILDYLMLSQSFARAELWERGGRFLALFSEWTGEPGVGMLRQVAMVLSREYVMGGISAYLDDGGRAHEKIMHGEHPIELQRRAWILSTLYGRGEARLRDAPIEACRYVLQARDGTSLAWIVADDGRQLLVFNDPTSELATFVEEGFADERDESGGRLDAELILMHRLLDGVPDDLRACIAARGETARGEVAEHAVEFGMLDGLPVPIMSGVLWFDGVTWYVPRGLMSIARENGFGIDSLGFRSAVRRPFRLGGDFTVDELTPRDGEQRAAVTAVFDACPYPQQERPGDESRLGEAFARDGERDGIIAEVEKVTAAWWNTSPDDAAFDDKTFTVAARELIGNWGRGVLSVTLGRSDPWTGDAAGRWVTALENQMTERWGAPLEMTATNRSTGSERRAPLARVLRATGLREGPLWWVNGHAVVLLSGIPSEDYSPDGEVLLVIATADSVVELLTDLYQFDVRRRARVIANLADIAAPPQGNRSALDARRAVAWNGPALEGSQIVPDAVRGGLRTGDLFWVWHFTHDDRGLLTLHVIGSNPSTFNEQVSLFEGVPDDLLSLVIDQDPDGLYPTVSREGKPLGDDLLAQARTLPNAKAVFYNDGFDWLASRGLLRAAHAVGLAEEATATAGRGTAADDGDVSTASMLPVLYSATFGVPQLRWALGVDGDFAPRMLAAPAFGQHCLSRVVSDEEAQEAFMRLGTGYAAALTGTLDDVLDVIADRVGRRHLLDAALSNRDPQNRREIALWLLGEGVDASIQLSDRTPINILFDNPTLDADDVLLLRRLLQAGADPELGALGVEGGRYPIMQLCERSDEDAVILPFVDELLESGRVHGTSWVSAGSTLLGAVRAGGFPVSRDALLQRLTEHAHSRAA